MVSQIIRKCRIFTTQLKVLPMSELFSLLRNALFFDEPIFVFKRDIVAIPEENARDGKGFKCAKGQLVDLEQLKSNIQPLPWEFQCHKFDGVKDFFVAKDNDGIQHITWIYYRADHNRLLSLGPDEVELKYCLTLPAKRGRGMLPTVLLSILRYLESNGIERAFTCVHRQNLPSIKGVEKAGFMRVGEIRLRKVLGFQISPRFDTLRRVP